MRWSARNRGKFVIDLKGSDNTQGNAWLLQAAQQLPRDRLVLDVSRAVLYHESDVIAYASWGSNDPDRKERHLGFHWLPGAIMTEYVSTNGRTFARPPDSWNIGRVGRSAKPPSAASPQSLDRRLHSRRRHRRFRPRLRTVSAIHAAPEHLCCRLTITAAIWPKATTSRFRLLSWMNIVVGDPLCSLGKP